MTGSSPAFPPEDLPAFLALCAGRWMALRSRFAITPAAETEATPEADDAWHDSDRGDLEVTLVSAGGSASLGELEVTPPQGAPQRLGFGADGVLHDANGPLGHWELWPDGSLELVVQREASVQRERIWFTKPNLRLRSCVVQGADGQPGQASFCSEIRRVSRPADGAG